MNVQSQAKKHLMEVDPNIYPSKVVVKKNGQLEVKKSYFYHFDATATDWATKVEKSLINGGFTVTVTGRDDWAAWPKTSYFTAIVTFK